MLRIDPGRRLVTLYEVLFADAEPLFTGDNELTSDRTTSMDIGFIGRAHESCDFAEITQIHETMVVDRHDDLQSATGSGYVEVYDQEGTRQSLRRYTDDFSDKLK